MPTKKLSAYDAAFEQHLADHHITFNDSDEYPRNRSEIKDRMVQRRRSLSPSTFSETDFASFRTATEAAATEKMLMAAAFPTMTGSATIPHGEDLPFANLEKLTNDDNADARPDFFDGCSTGELRKEVRKKLDKYISPSSNKSTPCIPNFFAEAQGPKRSGLVAKRQALYDGGLGARAVYKLRSYIDPETAIDKNAYTIVLTFDDSLLTFYSAHPYRLGNPERSVGYLITMIKRFFTTEDRDSFCRAVAALRNMRDWTKERRDELVVAANNKSLAMASVTSVSSENGTSSLS